MPPPPRVFSDPHEPDRVRRELTLAALPDAVPCARRFTKGIHPGHKRNSLSALLARHSLDDRATELAPGSQPHRALWDTAGAALLLAALIESAPGGLTITLDQLHRFAGIPLGDDPAETQTEAEQLPLLDL